MWLAAHPPTSSFSAGDVHRFEGIIVYFGGLVLLYELVRRLDRRASWRRFILPLGCYYLVTLALPLVNGMRAGEAFFAHAAIVLFLPPALILFVCATRWLVSTLVPSA